MALPTSVLLLLLTTVLRAAAAGSPTFPATVEFDLVFPRNDSYAPAPIIPIVFAIQNSQLAATLDPSIQYSVLGTANSSRSIDSGLVDLRQANFSASNPYYTYAWIEALNGIEGQWTIVWTLGTGNCSGSQGTGASTFTGINKSKSVIFTTKNGTQEPDLASSNGTCAAAGIGDSFTFDVTGTLNVTQTNEFDGRSACAVLASTVPTASPCGANIGATVASSISAGITSIACAATSPAISCPSASGKSSSARKTARVPGCWSMGLILAGSCLVSWLYM